MADIRESQRVSRRRMLGTLSAGAAGVLAGPALIRSDAQAAKGRPPHACAAAAASPTSFGRLFDLEPFARNTARLQQALLEIAKPGGLLDARDDLAAGPVALITDPALSDDNPNNPTHTAGTTFLGQFVDHDVTFDAGSRLAIATDPAQARNFRSPQLDLDSLYGAGWVAQQELYDGTDRVKLKLESGGLFEDLPRRADGSAIVGDPRNDGHLVVAGLHCAFALAHNHCVDRVRAGGATDPGEVFAAARRLVTWHYHWIVLHEHLPQVCGQAQVDQVLARRRRLFRP